MHALNEFCAPLELRPFDATAAIVYGRVRANLERAGLTIGPMDLLIAAHALAEGATLVTSNRSQGREVAQAFQPVHLEGLPSLGRLESPPHFSRKPMFLRF